MFDFTYNTEAICPELWHPSQNLSDSSQFFPERGAGPPKAICSPPASFETSSFLLPTPQMPLHSGTPPHQTQPGLLDSGKFLPSTPYPSQDLSILFTKGNKCVDSGTVSLILFVQPAIGSLAYL